MSKSCFLFLLTCFTSELISNLLPDLKLLFETWRYLAWREQPRHQRKGALGPSQSDGATPRSEDFHVMSASEIESDEEFCMICTSSFTFWHQTMFIIIESVGWRTCVSASELWIERELQHVRHNRTPENEDENTGGIWMYFFGKHTIELPKLEVRIHLPFAPNRFVNDTG